MPVTVARGPSTRPGVASDHDPRPCPSSVGLDDVTRTLSGFAGSTNGEERHGIDDPVTDDDRTRYGFLLDHAAEHGLLTMADTRSGSASWPMPPRSTRCAGS